jgi:putative membrane protein
MTNVTPDGRPQDSGGDRGPEDLPVTLSPVHVPAAHDMPAPDEGPVVPATEDALAGAVAVDVGVAATAGGVGIATSRFAGAGDLEPPRVGTDKVGSIPAVSASRAWAKGQWSNWRLHLVRFVSAGLSVLIAVALVPGLSFTAWRWGEGLEIALIFALLNAFVKPVLQFASLRFLFSSYGIVIVLINTALLLLLSWIMDDSVRATSLLALLVGGALIGLIGGAVDAMLGANYPMLDRDYKERNNLP